MQLSLATLRPRHQFCITLHDISRDVKSGRIDRATYDRWMEKGKLAGHCDHPDDVICAAPSIDDEKILEAIRTHQERIGGT